MVFMVFIVFQAYGKLTGPQYNTPQMIHSMKTTGFQLFFGLAGLKNHEKHWFSIVFMVFMVFQAYGKQADGAHSLRNNPKTMKTIENQYLFWFFDPANQKNH